MCVCVGASVHACKHVLKHVYLHMFKYGHIALIWKFCYLYTCILVMQHRKCFLCTMHMPTIYINPSTGTLAVVYALVI